MGSNSSIYGSIFIRTETIASKEKNSMDILSCATLNGICMVVSSVHVPKP